MTLANGGQANLRGRKIHLFLQQLTGHRMRWRDSQTIDELKIMLLLSAEVKSDWWSLFDV